MAGVPVHVLQHIVDLFGTRLRADHDGCTWFGLSNCQADLLLPNRLERASILLTAISIHGFQFDTGAQMTMGEAVTVVLTAAGMGTECWLCRIVHLAEDAGNLRHVMVRIDAPCDERGRQL